MNIREIKFEGTQPTSPQTIENKQKKNVKNSLQISAKRRTSWFVKRNLTADQVVDLMKKQQGDRTQQAYAEELGITPQFLCDILKRRRDPGPKVLSQLGLSQKVTYERTA